jgi:O-antigen/teichoic acid export membrane protein
MMDKPAASKSGRSAAMSPRGLFRGAIDATGALIRSPLTRNGYALVASTAVTSVLGVVFWVLAARLYPAQQVGLGGVLISTMVTLSSASQLNFGNVLNRFVPVAGSRAGRLILVAYAAALTAALIIAGAFLLAANRLMPELAFLTTDPLLAVVFPLAVATWSIFALQDSALAALRKAVWVPVENTVYSIAKIVLLLVFAGLAALGVSIFAAWTAPLVVIVGVVNLWIFGVVLPRRATSSAVPADLSPRAMARFFGWDYAGGLAMTAAMGIAPLLVLSNGGPTASANYHLSWTITYSLYLIGRSMGISLLSESAADPARASALAADAVVHTMVPLVGAALAIALGAPILMAIFGPSYVEEGTALLRVLAISSIPWGMVTIFLAIARARGWMLAIVLTQVATLVLLVGLGVLLLAVMGPLGMGVAWLTTHTLVAVAIASVATIRGGPDRAIEWLLSLASSLARFLGPFLRFRDTRGPDPATDQAIESALRDTDEPGATAWRPVGSIRSQSDSSIQFLGVPADAANGGGPAAVLKIARSVQGIAALQRGHERLDILRADPRVQSADFALPRPLALKRTADALIVIEAAIAGEDGRTALRRLDQRGASLAFAARAITMLHNRTSVLHIIDDAWLVRWIDQPGEQIERIVGNPGSPWKRAALRALGEHQRAFWRGREVRLGTGHGDFSPGNILFAPTRPEPDQSQAETRVAGIVDWDRARDDAPPGFDLCHLLITTRVLLMERELGLVVRDILQHPHLDGWELAWLEEADAEGEWSGDPVVLEAMVGLVWLHHVAANIEKSERYGVSGLWTAANVDWVLRTFRGKGSEGDRARHP